MDDLDDLGCSPSLLYSELFTTAFTGELDRFKRLAVDYAKVEGIGVKEAMEKLGAKYEKGFLQIAAEGGSLQVCKYLIETLKLDVDSIYGNGQTPLCWAIAKENHDTVRYLLEKGANADATIPGNYTPLHYAAKTGDTNIVTSLLSRGARVDVASMSGTALLAAAAGGHRDAVKVLLDHGANPNADSDEMFRPLIKAVFANSRECVELLLQAGADPNAVSYGNTPLIVAAKDGTVDVITLLLEAGADPNYKMN
ncbi:hypothetical protein MKW94_018522, partial [Papaver nudicaule]|nr:hypothetical protein [Papaver nudicaule]